MELLDRFRRSCSGSRVCEILLIRMISMSQKLGWLLLRTRWQKEGQLRSMGPVVDPDSVCSGSDVVEETVSASVGSEVEAVIGGTVESDDVDAAGAALAEEVDPPTDDRFVDTEKEPEVDTASSVSVFELTDGVAGPLPVGLVVEAEFANIVDSDDFDVAEAGLVAVADPLAEGRAVEIAIGLVVDPDSVCSGSDVVEETVSVSVGSEVEAVIGGTVESDDIDAADAKLAEEVDPPTDDRFVDTEKEPKVDTASSVSVPELMDEVAGPLLVGLVVEAEFADIVDSDDFDVAEAELVAVADTLAEGRAVEIAMGPWCPDRSAQCQTFLRELFRFQKAQRWKQLSVGQWSQVTSTPRGAELAEEVDPPTDDRFVDIEKEPEVDTASECFCARANG